MSLPLIGDSDAIRSANAIRLAAQPTLSQRYQTCMEQNKPENLSTVSDATSGLNPACQPQCQPSENYVLRQLSQAGHMHQKSDRCESAETSSLSREGWLASSATFVFEVLAGKATVDRHRSTEILSSHSGFKPSAHFIQFDVGLVNPHRPEQRVYRRTH